MAQRITTEAAKASRAIKAELYKAFPGVKFSVTSENFAGGNSIDVRYTDGPTEVQVNEYTDKYEYGKFDGMNDIYEITNRRNDIPLVKYLSVQREMSEEARKQITSSIGMIQDESEQDSNRRVYQAFQEWTTWVTTKVETPAEKTPEEAGQELVEQFGEARMELADQLEEPVAE
ncbi:MAG: LPD29 domain-containing protein, partial [Bacteroidota bacterium]